MNTINLSQFDLITTSNFKTTISPTILDKLAIGQTSTNILRLNETNVVLDKLTTLALQNVKTKYKETTLVIKTPAPTNPKP
ncbi:MAG: hypothetical protein ACO1N0_15020 [Fluviicola sp.]|jgi:hypothetical protein